MSLCHATKRNDTHNNGATAPGLVREKRASRPGELTIDTA
jgi:hypothetical protein